MAQVTAPAERTSPPAPVLPAGGRVFGHRCLLRMREPGAERVRRHGGVRSA
ncbi:hypothetical protein [Streptomyces synnematoformans]|uniref:hypothetical protein n=1 Tax=Streptomyces synnematoformans TaxID=415721 RepID=UPI0031DE8843